MNLLLDIGHTRAKFGTEQEGLVRRQAAFRLGDTEALCAALRDAQGQAEDLWAVSTRQGPMARELRCRIEEAWGRSAAWVDAARACGGIRVRYARPETFGADRLLAMQAARRRTSAPVIVVDAGTAVTVDGLTADGRHCGGWILPGYARLRDGMQELLALEEPLEPSPDGILHAGTTEAVEAGIRGCLAGGVDRMCRQLCEAELGSSAVVMATGGDGEALCRWCRTEMAHAPDLVLEGLAAHAAEQGR